MGKWGGDELAKLLVIFAYMSTNRVIFFITADVHILDLAGALQAFYEAGYYGHPYDIVYISDRVDQVCSARMQLAGLKDYTSVAVSGEDIVIIPGFDLRQMKEPVDGALTAWLRNADAVGATICSVRSEERRVGKECGDVC